MTSTLNFSQISLPFTRTPSNIFGIGHRVNPEQLFFTGKDASSGVGAIYRYDFTEAKLEPLVTGLRGEYHVSRRILSNEFIP